VTAAAVEDFQESESIEATGRADIDTLDALGFDISGIEVSDP
jgi:hypothetical protein